jgi:hypothetical protein
MLTLMAYINQDFLSSPEYQRSIRNDVLSILDGTNIQPIWHPMHDAFWYALIESAVDTRKRLDALNPESNPGVSDVGSEYWKAIWEVATTVGKGGLENLARRIVRFVLPLMKETWEQSELVRKLDVQSNNDRPGGRETAMRDWNLCMSTALATP